MKINKNVIKPGTIKRVILLSAENCIVALIDLHKQCAVNYKQRSFLHTQACGEHVVTHFHNARKTNKVHNVESYTYRDR